MLLLASNFQKLKCKKTDFEAGDERQVDCWCGVQMGNQPVLERNGQFAHRNRGDDAEKNLS